MAITFRRAVRENISSIIGLAGPSGSGKTYSALRLAAGMSGGKPFAVIDTEAGRATHYAEQFTFDHADLRPPFRPDAYREAIAAADQAGYPVIVVDSCSHEHAGEGGLLDWHDEIVEEMVKGRDDKRAAVNLAAWKKPKLAHKQMISKLLQLRSHIILCFRAEQKVDIQKDSSGKTIIVPKTLASGFSDWIPVCEKNMLYELTCSFLLTPDAPGIPKPIKLQEQMRAMIDLKAPLSEKTGQHIAEWAQGAGRDSTRQSAQGGIACGPVKALIGESPQSCFTEQSELLDNEAALRDAAGDAKRLQQVFDGMSQPMRSKLFTLYQDLAKQAAKTAGKGV